MRRSRLCSQALTKIVLFLRRICSERMSKILLILVVIVLSSTGCRIPKKDAPVCGTNGKSYVNARALQCFNQANPVSKTRIAYMGRCIRPEIPECSYSINSRPICGSDNVTYLNAAMLTCKSKLYPLKNVTIFKKGHC